MDDELDLAWNSSKSKSNGSLLIELLKPFRIRVCITLGQCSDLLRVILVLFRFLFHDAMFQTVLATTGRLLLGINIRLLRFAIRAEAHQELFLFLYFALDADGLLFLPSVLSERLLVQGRRLLDFGNALLELGILREASRNCR